MSVQSGTEKPAPPVLKGSELLLRKLPLYAQAQQYLLSGAADPLAEINTLSYGAETYPILALVRACRTAAAAVSAAGDGGNLTGGTGNAPPLAAASGVDLSPGAFAAAFTGINDARLYNLPFQRRWHARVASSSPAEGRVETAAEAQARRADSSFRVRIKAESELLNAAVGVTAAADAVAAAVRPLAVPIARESGKLRRAREESKQASDLPAAVAPKKRSRAEEADDKGDEDGVGELEWWLDATAAAATRVLRAKGRGRRGRTQAIPEPSRNSPASLYESNLANHATACPEERAVVAALLRHAAPAAPIAAAAASPTTPGSPATAAAAVDAADWGTRMAALLSAGPPLAGTTERGRTAAGGSSGGAVTPREAQLQQRQMQAYLKRVTWIDRQRTAAFAGGGVGAAVDIRVVAQPRWTALGPAERVRQEMARTGEQRKRFRRARGGGDDDA